VRHAASRARDLGPVRKVVRVAVGVVDEAAVLDDEPARRGAVAPRVPALGRPAGEAHDRVDRALEVLAFGRLVRVLVADPAPAVARDLVAVAEERVDDRRMPQHRHAHAEDREGHAAVAEEPQQPPDAGARPVLVERLHAQVPHPERLRADDVREEGFGGLVAVQHGVLAAFLVVEHELDGDPRAAGPARVRRILAVPGKVAGGSRDRKAGSAWRGSLGRRARRENTAPWPRLQPGGHGSNLASGTGWPYPGAMLSS
jgi:hypothetical protein